MMYGPRMEHGCRSEFRLACVGRVTLGGRIARRLWVFVSCSALWNVHRGMTVRTESRAIENGHGHGVAGRTLPAAIDARHAVAASALFARAIDELDALDAGGFHSICVLH